MTVRLPPSVIENIWHDAQRVSQKDLETEQDHVDQTIAAVVNNHFGSGVLPSQLTQNILFDSDDLSADQVALVAADIFDGTGIQVSSQPSDINLGNQIEIVLSGSDVKGRSSVKVAVIGLSFDGSLQLDRFYFFKNESQVTKRHYKEILAIFFNDFKGNDNCSHNLGGRIIIREAASFQISRDAIMVSQDLEPDLFWRDFKKPDDSSTLEQIIQAGIGSEYSVDGLNITSTSSLTDKELIAGDVSSMVGQKFQGLTDNLQKVTLLLGVEEISGALEENKFNWTGDLIVSIYPLQTSIACQSDIVPDLAIEFDPSISPVAQVSFNQSTLKDAGYILNDVLQPVDFVFSGTPIGNSGGIVVSSYYAVTIKRSGAANLNDIHIGVADDRTDNSRETLFSGSVWVDNEEEDLWFQIWTDAIKIADGAGYDAGNPMSLSKTTVDNETGATIDNEAGGYSFEDTGQNVLNVAIIQATSTPSQVSSDERNGNPIYTRQQFEPTLSLISESDLESLQSVSEPLIVGGVKDTNPAEFTTIEQVQSYPGMAVDNKFTIVNPDADLLSTNLLGSKFVPNKANAGTAYKIVEALRCTNLLGDVLGVGVIDASSLAAAAGLVGESLSSSTTQQKIIDGYFTALEILRADVNGDGYVDALDLNELNNYINKVTNSFSGGSSFTTLQLTVEELTGRYDYIYCREDGYFFDGYTGTEGNFDDLSSSEIIYDGYLVSPVINLDPVFTTVPFSDVTYQIIHQPFWQPWLIALSSATRQVPAAFTYSNAVDESDCTSTSASLCENLNETIPSVDPGRTDFSIPDNLIIGTGQILRPDGAVMKQDFEIGIVEINMPTSTLVDSSINVFDAFVADRGSGLTSKGYSAMKYADCSSVQPEDLALGRVRFTAVVGSIYAGLDLEVTPQLMSIGVLVDQDTGMLTFDTNNLQEDNVYLTLTTKIIVTVYLKKAGWNNPQITVSSSQVAGLIGS